MNNVVCLDSTYKFNTLPLFDPRELFGSFMAKCLAVAAGLGFDSQVDSVGSLWFPPPSNAASSLDQSTGLELETLDGLNAMNELTHSLFKVHPSHT